MGLRFVIEAWDPRRYAGVGLHLGHIEVQLSPPDEPRILAEVDDVLEEALEEIDPEALADPGQAGVVWEELVESIAQVPAMGQIQAGGLDELAL